MSEVPSTRFELLTPAQRGAFVLVSRGIGSVKELEHAAAQLGIQRGRRAWQRLLRRMCLKGFLKAVAFPKETGRRGHFHVTTPKGHAACQHTDELHQKLAPAGLALLNRLEQPEHPLPDWASAATEGVTKPRKRTEEEKERELWECAPRMMNFRKSLEERRRREPPEYTRFRGMRRTPSSTRASNELFRRIMKALEPPKKPVAEEHEAE